MKFKTNILRQQQIGFEACKLILNDLSPRAVSEPMNRLNEHEVSHIPFFAHSPFFCDLLHEIHLCEQIHTLKKLLFYPQQE